MLARKQPFIQRVRNSSLVERLRVDNKRASSVPPKPWASRYSNISEAVGEHSAGVEAAMRMAVELAEKQL